VIAVRAKIRLRDQDAAPIVPIIVPELDAVRQFAVQLHAAGQPWQGEAFGWDAEYSPERPTTDRLPHSPPTAAAPSNAAG
jgi:hypothetical protein